MGRTVAIVGNPRSVWDRTTPGGGLTPGAIASATPGTGAELKLLHQARHLNRANVYPKLASLSSACREVAFSTAFASDS